MKRILVIDDLRVFPHLPNAVYARTSAEGLGQLMTGGSWDEVWWDHDLGGDDTTIPCLTALEECYHDFMPAPIARCYVHTANPVGARTLALSLARMYPTVRVDAGTYGCTTIDA